MRKYVTTVRYNWSYLIPHHTPTHTTKQGSRAIDIFRQITQELGVQTWPSGKLSFECQKIDKILTFFSKKLTKIVIFFNKIAIVNFLTFKWQFSGESAADLPLWHESVLPHVCVFAFELSCWLVIAQSFLHHTSAPSEYQMPHLVGKSPSQDRYVLKA